MTGVKIMVTQAFEKLNVMLPKEFIKMWKSALIRAMKHQCDCPFCEEQQERIIELEALLMGVWLRGEPMRGESHWITVDDVDGKDWFEARDSLIGE